MLLPTSRLTDCEGRLQRDFSEFAKLWSRVRESWLDDRCRKFEKDHLSTIGPSLGRFTAALHEFTDALRKADMELRDDKR
jgi:hypothetical protein